MVRRHATKEVIRMRKLIIATTALAFLSSTGMAAYAQSTAAPAASGDSMSKGDMSKDKMSKSKKNKKSKKSSDDTSK